MKRWILLLALACVSTAQLPKPGGLAVGGGSGSTTRTWSYIAQGTVQGGATGFGCNLPAASAPSLVNAGGTVPAAVLQYPTSQSTYYCWMSFIIPTGYSTNAAFSYTVESTCDVATTCDSTHANRLILGLACSGTSATLNNPTFTNAAAVNITNAGSGNQTITTGSLTPNSGGLPSCAAGQRAWVKIIVDTNTNTLTGPFDLASFTLTLTAGI